MSGKEIGRIATEPTYSAAYSPDGALVVSGDQDGVLHLWDSSTRRELQSVKAHEGAVRCVCFARKAKLATGGAGGVGRLWDLKALQEEAESDSD